METEEGIEKQVDGLELPTHNVNPVEKLLAEAQAQEAPTENQEAQTHSQDAAPQENNGQNDDKEELLDNIRLVLCSIYDPEIPVSIYEMGLIYEIDIDACFDVVISMTLTSPACPVAGSLPGEVEEKIEAIDGINSATVELTWDPPWTPEMMTDEAKLELGFF